MHKIKNKKIISIILGGLVAITATSPYIYANEIEIKENSSINLSGEENSEGNDNKEDGSEGVEDKVEVEEVISINLIEVNNEENLGKKVKVNGEVESIKDGIIVIKDSSGTATLFFNNIENKEIKVGNNITVVGKIENINDSICVVIYNSSDIEINNNDDKNDVDNDNSNNGGNSGNLNDEDKKPESNNQSSSQVKPNQSTNTNKQENLGNINSNSENDSSTSVKKIYARSYITITKDLTDSQWEKVKTALAEGTIKVVDLPNNKIRIKYVSNGYGDKVWIVNDPRGLDEEVEEKVKTIGVELAKSISYSDYNISKSNWDAILEKIENGTAKLKIVDDKNLKVIYNKNGKVDTTKIVEKK